MRDLTAHLRQLVVVQTLGEAPDSFSVTADQTARLEAQARALPQAEAVRAIDLVADALAAVKEGSDARIQLEVALLKAARPRSDASIEALLLRIEQLERALDGEVAEPPKPPTKKETPAKKDNPEPVLAAAPPPGDEPVVGHRDAVARGAGTGAGERGGGRDAGGAARRRATCVARR